MELVAALVAFGPVLGLVVLLAIRTRQLWPRRPVTWVSDRPDRGWESSGDREPRRPLVPAGAGSISLPEPHEDAGDEGPPAAPIRTLAPPYRRGLRAS